MTFRQQRMIFAPVTLGRCDEANATVTMLKIVPSGVYCAKLIYTGLSQVLSNMKPF